MPEVKSLFEIKSLKLKNKGDGHRKRLRERFLQSGLSGFLDYEIVELLLTLGTPMKDCKQMSKEAIKKFKGLAGVLDASLEDLQQINGIGTSNAFGIKLFQAVSEEYARVKIPKKISFTSSLAVAKYLQEKLGRVMREYFVMLCLDSRNNLIKISDISIGSLNTNIIHPREIFKEAIKNNSAFIIIAHNHPSGETDPSGEDKVVTKRLIEAGTIMGIEVLDHIIISKTSYFSFKENKLI